MILVQVYGQFPDDKYKNFSYANMAGDLARIVGLEAVREFVRRIVFSAAVGNADMHLKNWTLLYPDARTPKLSPAYDLVSTIAYIEDFTMALSLVAKEKDVRNFDEQLLRRFAEKALVTSSGYRGRGSGNCRANHAGLAKDRRGSGDGL